MVLGELSWWDWSEVAQVTRWSVTRSDCSRPQLWSHWCRSCWDINIVSIPEHSEQRCADRAGSSQKRNSLSTGGNNTLLLTSCCFVLEIRDVEKIWSREESFTNIRNQHQLCQLHSLHHSSSKLPLPVAMSSSVTSPSSLSLSSTIVSVSSPVQQSTTITTIITSLPASQTIINYCSRTTTGNLRSGVISPRHVYLTITS